jgi:hypothetical protein
MASMSILFMIVSCPPNFQEYHAFYIFEIRLQGEKLKADLEHAKNVCRGLFWGQQYCPPDERREGVAGDKIARGQHAAQTWSNLFWV